MIFIITLIQKNDCKPNNCIYQSKEEKETLYMETPAAIRCGEIKFATGKPEW